MQKKKRIMIIAHFCDVGNENSNNRFNYLANMLVNYGYEVELVTSSFSHRDKRQREMVPKGSFAYSISLIYEPTYMKNVSIKRLCVSHTVMAKNLRKYLMECAKPDLIYCAIPSVSVAKVAAEYAKRASIPFVIDIQDLWPEGFKMKFNIPVLSNLLFSPMKKGADFVYQSADKVVAVSNTYKDRGLSVNSKDHSGICIFLGTDLDEFDSTSNKISVNKDSGELWITYAGTLGASYNIELILDALNRMEDDLLDNVIFKIMGDGPYLERFKKYAKMNCKAKVDFLGRLDYSQMASILQHSDIAVNPIVKGSLSSIINKHADYAAAGLPIVNTQHSEEYRRLIDKYNCGINCGEESVLEVSKALSLLLINEGLRKQMGIQSRKLAEDLFDRKNTYPKIIDIIKQLVGE